MKLDIIIAGVGGQGILSIAASIGTAALNNNLYLKQSEVHGMSQRGGDVQSHLRISSQPIHSDLIPKGMADLIISIEPMESLRYLPYLKRDGWIVTNTIPFINVADYPDIEILIKEIQSHKNNITINADKIASEIGSPKSANMVILGAATPFLQMSYEEMEKGIKQIFDRKGEAVVETNIKALKAGWEYTKSHR
ncbi:MAG: indolepyruvate oxidoreductase [Bacteroidetes bacterium GWA2_30_7]|nr:MAG: indolepyruvate oxidoreductase [Bacteroidetes bacterium GWA2_30_7]